MGCCSKIRNAGFLLCAEREGLQLSLIFERQARADELVSLAELSVILKQLLRGGDVAALYAVILAVVVHIDDNVVEHIKAGGAA